MTREKEISKAALEYANEEIIAAPYDAFMVGAQWADKHPHWISVEERLPKDGQYAATINKVGVQDVRYYAHGKWYSNFGNEYDDITHWMRLPSIEHLKVK